MTTPIDFNRARFYDAVTAGGRLKHSLLSKERELTSTKWFGYRMLSPLAATKLFYELYAEARLSYVRSEIDVGLVGRLNSPKFDQLKSSDFAAAWTARQRADEYAVPYDLYIDFAHWFWGRRSRGGRSRAPRINQLHFTETSRIAWQAEFAKFVLDRLELYVHKLADVPQLRSAVYRGEPAQRQTREFILELCRNGTSNWENCVRKWCYDYPLMSPTSMRGLLSTRQDMRAVVTSLRKDPPPRSSLGQVEVDLRPACFAVPSTHDPVASVCATCSFAQGCEGASKLVTRRLIEETGHADPRRHAEREKANAREQKSYAKKRAGTVLVEELARLPQLRAGT